MGEDLSGTDPLHSLRLSGVPRLAELHRRPDAVRPASNAQQRLWFLSRLEGGVATYSEPVGFRVKGELSLDRLDRALTKIVARHEVFRTGLVEHDGSVWQEVSPPMRMRTGFIKARSLAEGLDLAHAEAAVPFDLSRPPLLRSLCVQVGPQERLLVFIFHHAAIDAWSLGIFYAELSAWYRSHSAAEALLPEPPLQYGDYADWQRRWLGSLAAQAQRDYWRERLAGPLPVLHLDYACASPATRSYDGTVKRFTLHDGQHECIKALAESQGTTVFVILLSAYLATLHRYSLQDDIIVGVPVACRSFAETEGIIGYFTNTLALRSAISCRLRFSELVAQTSKTFFDGLEHQELPFDQVVDSLDLVRGKTSNPVFQAMFVMQNTPVDAVLRLKGVELEEVPIHTGAAKVDVTCSVKASGSSITLEVEYSTEVLSEAAGARFVDAFANLLSDAVSRPDAPLKDLAMLSPEEAASRIGAPLAHCERYPDFQPAHVHFELQARRLPDAVAIEAGGKMVRYAELNERANRLARYLAVAGVGPESLVAVCLDRGVDLIVALLATLKAGAGFVPLDPRFPFERIRRICEDAKLQVILTQERSRPMLAELPVSLIDVASHSAVGEATDPKVAVSPANIAYVYYTSGSTGVPKGVVIEHRCAMNRLEWLRRRYHLDVSERVLHKTPLIFDVAIWEIFLPLMAGATILMAKAGAESDVAHIAELLSAKGMVLAHFVPSMLDAYLSYAPQATYPDLKWVALSGEAVSNQLLERFTEHFAVELHNQYGQTETSEVSVWEGMSAAGTKTVPIGRQIGVYRLHVLDGQLNPVPPGVPGELCVTSEDGLARGYHTQPELTAEKFVPNPYPLFSGERLYRTGDLARISEDGVIEYLGRLDRQTKIRGCRVETAEVEAVLSSQSSVRSCRVVACPDETGANQLIAYVVSDSPSATELGAHAERFLPSFMRPAAYVFLHRLPLTPSGKLDRTKLPTPKPSDLGARGSEDPPQILLEEQIATLWKQVLGLKKVGRADNFFAVGGNSIRSVQVLARIKHLFGIEISVPDFFASPTIEGLAKITERALERLIMSMSETEVAQRLGEKELN